MDQQTIRALITSAYAAREKGDLDGVIAAFHPDVDYTLAGDTKTLALLGSLRGRDNLRGVMSGLIDSFEFVKRDILDMIIGDDAASVHSRLQIRFVPKDVTFTSEVLDVFHFQDGKIVKFVEFADTALIRDVISA